MTGTVVKIDRLEHLPPKERARRFTDRLRVCGKTIDQHRLEIGAILNIFIPAGLYKFTHDTIDAYVRDVFGIGRSRANQLRHYAELSTIVDNEAQARELYKYRDRPEIQARALDAVGDNKDAATLLAALQKEDLAESIKAEADATASRVTTRGSVDWWTKVENWSDTFRKQIWKKCPDVAPIAEAQLEALLATLRGSSAA